MAATSTSANESGLSEYEELRLRKIKRNEDRLKELGLFRMKDDLAAAVKKKNVKRKNATPRTDRPARKSSRKRKPVVNYSDETVIPMFEDDEEKAAEEDYNKFEEIEPDDEGEEYNGDGASDDDESEEYEENEERPKKKTRLTLSNKLAGPKHLTKSPAPDTSFHCIHPQGGLTLEYAKTGRSTCRKCRTKIEKGEPRVGMEAWIVGRTCVTWQRPECLLQNLTVEIANGGQAKCRAPPHAPFTKGQVKVGIRCHTATRYYCLEAVGGVLANVVSLMRAKDSCETFILTINDIDGHEKLSMEQAQKLTSVLETLFHVPEAKSFTGYIKAEDTMPQPVSKRNKEQNCQSPNHQPKTGRKTGAKGRVEWKFGGRSCYGTLIPRMETKTHCFARTHKGNVKTLAKGKSYWSIRSDDAS